MKLKTKYTLSKAHRRARIDERETKFVVKNFAKFDQANEVPTKRPIRDRDHAEVQESLIIPYRMSAADEELYKRNHYI